MTDRQTLLSLCSEAEFLEHVVGYARLQHWRAAHFRPARTARGWRTAVSADGEGFPDLVMARGGRLIFVECKSSKGKVSPAQQSWLDALVPCAEVHVWRPADWDLICEVLK